MINVITVSDNIKIISTLSKIFDNNTEINASFSQINDVTKNLFENDKINLVIFTELISEKENNDLLQIISTKKIPSLFILNANQISNLPSETIYNNFMIYPINHTIELLSRIKRLALKNTNNLTKSNAFKRYQITNKHVIFLPCENT